MTAAAHAMKSGVYSPKARWIALVAFVLVAFLLGGSSRHDVTSLIVLRPLSALFLVYALIGMSREAWREFRGLFLLLIALVVLIWVQLIPLPPSIWASLPAREAVAALGEAMGMADLWRPITLSPFKTWNTLFSLVVPAAALALFAIQEDDARRKVWIVLVIAALGTIALGILQILGGRGSTLYFYAYTQPGYAAGLYSNRNHQGVFLATMLVVSAWWFASLKPREPQAALKGFMALAPVVLIIPAIFLAGSRAGLICAALAAPVALWLVGTAPLMPETFTFGRKRKISRKFVMGAFAGLLVALVGVIALSSRALALNRLLADESLEDLRWDVLPVLTEMAGAMFVSGSGFGAFEYAYKIYEPDSLLSPKYLNNAHNDWMQFAIEGGFVAIAILLLLIAGIALKALKAWRSDQSELRRRRLMAVAVIGLFGIASAVDYPLRTPSLMAFFTIACATVWMGAQSVQPESNSKRRR